MTKFDGGCTCGAARYRLSTEPLTGAPKRVTAKLSAWSRTRLPADPIALGRFLIGQLLVRVDERRRLIGRIVETEVYLEDDEASHSFAGPTRRNRSMYLPRGHAYIYRIYGMWRCLNVSAGREGEGAAVLLRALEPIAGVDHMQTKRGGAPLRDLARGPGRLCEAFSVDETLDGVDLCSPAGLWLARGRSAPSIGESVRIGLTKSVDRRLRFYERGSSYLSGPRSLNL